MPRHNRSIGRDVFIYNAEDRATVIGGMVLTNGITNANIYSMVEILIVFTTDFELQTEEGPKIHNNEDPLRPGNYYISSTGEYLKTSYCNRVRSRSASGGTPGGGTCVPCFREAVQARDGIRCVISGKEFARARSGFWEGLEAAHIFPLAHEGRWREWNFGRWITLQPLQGGAINSVQNGLMLESTIHLLFDTYIISVNPDDEYKIVYFRDDDEGLAGKHLDRQLLDHPQRPLDQLLRWHFRQAVLTNMRGAGEAHFEHDFPPGSDMVGEILNGPRAPERMEFELFNRLGTGSTSLT